MDGFTRAGTNGVKFGTSEGREKSSFNDRGASLETVREHSTTRWIFSSVSESAKLEYEGVAANTLLKTSSFMGTHMSGLDYKPRAWSGRKL